MILYGLSKIRKLEKLGGGGGGGPSGGVGGWLVFAKIKDWQSQLIFLRGNPRYT